MKRLVVCADDYGLAPGVSRGIRELLDARRIFATSAMVIFPDWAQEAVQLQGMKKGRDIGLHLTLTDFRPLTGMGHFESVGKTMAAAFKGQLPLRDIEKELKAQLQCFCDHMGQKPSHLDGHHHVHQLPGVREIVLKLAKENGAYVRNSFDSLPAILRRGVAKRKSLMLAGLGTSMKRGAKRAGIATNHGFAGAYVFDSEKQTYGDLFSRFIRASHDTMLVFTHPGYVDDVLRSRDGLTDLREQELQFFKSDDYAQMLKDKGLVLGPMLEAVQDFA